MRRFRYIVVLLWVLPAFATHTCTTCYIAGDGTGDDTKDGTTKTVSGAHGPWAHAPGMPNCASVCATQAPAAGDSYIFQGGETWHMGNSGATPYTGGTWTWNWNGSAGNNIYVGVDKTWFGGGSWVRPIFNGDNPICNASTLGSNCHQNANQNLCTVGPTNCKGLFYVDTCTYHVGPSNKLLNWQGISYTTIDNLELTGLCQDDTRAPFANDVYLEEVGAGNNLYENDYLHGWSHAAFTCGGAGVCFDMAIVLGSGVAGDRHFKFVIDGADSDPGGAQCFYSGLYDIDNSTIRYVVGASGSNFHIFHDNLMDHLYQPDDGAAHGNVYEGIVDNAVVNVFYNNVIRHVCTDTTSCTAGVVGIWPEPPATATEYFFNNVFVDNPSTVEGFIISQNDRNQGQLNIFNNTFEQTTSGEWYGCSATFSSPSAMTNNHYIFDQSPYVPACAGENTILTENVMSHTTATADGYTGAQAYAYSPTSPSSPTVGNGTNKQSYCSALSTAAGSDATLSDSATACQSDTKYACTYDAVNHLVNTCPARTPVLRPASAAWDQGAYQESGPVTPVFSPNGGTFTANPSVTITCGSGATCCYTTNGGTPTAATPGTCDQSTYSTPVSIPSTLTLKAIGTEVGFTNSSVQSALFTMIPLIAPGTLAFGNQTVNTTSAGQVETFTNNTGVTITWTGTPTLTTGTQFAVSANTCSGTLTNTSSCTTTITFTPTTAGAKSDTVTYTDSDASSPQTVGLTGTGVSSGGGNAGTMTRGTVLTQGASIVQH